MKLGCMFKSIAILIVIIGTLFYLYDKYGKDFVEIGKEKAKTIAMEEIDNILSQFNTDDISESLKKKIENLTDDFEKHRNEFTDKQWSELKDKFDEVTKNKKIDDKTLEDLKKIIDSAKNKSK